MIKTLSPYYISTPFINPTTLVTSTYYTMSIFVWSGDKNTPPSIASRVFTKQNPTGSTGNDNVNIARLVSSFLEFSPQSASATSLLDGVNQRWVKHSVVYSDDLVTEENINTTLLLKGYGYGNEGENTQPPSNKIMIEGNEFNVNRDGVFCLPILLDTV